MEKMQKKVLIFVVLFSQLCDSVQTLEREERQENATAEPEATTVPEPGPTATPEPEGTATPEPQPKVTTTQESDPTTEQECTDLDCENGGTAFSNSSGVCQCRCTDEYQGTLCDQQRSLVQYALTFTLKSNSTFNETFQNFTEVVSQLFNENICIMRTYLNNTCCTRNTVERTTGFGGLEFLRPTTEDQHVLGRYETTEESGETKTFKFSYYMTVDPNNTFCRHAYGEGDERRKRQAELTEGQPLSQDKVFEALDEFRETFNTLLKESGIPLELFERLVLELRPGVDETTATPLETTTETPPTQEPCNQPEPCAPPPPPCNDPPPCNSNNGLSDCQPSPCDSNNRLSDCQRPPCDSNNSLPDCQRPPCNNNNYG